MDRSQAGGGGAAHVSSMEGESGTLLSIQSRIPLLFHHSCIFEVWITICTDDSHYFYMLPLFFLVLIQTGSQKLDDMSEKESGVQTWQKNILDR